MLDQKIVSELEIVGHLGAGSASSAISSFIGKPVNIRLTGVCVEAIEEIPEKLGGSAILSVGLLSRVCGEVEGNSLLIFTEKDAMLMVKILGEYSGCKTGKEYSSLERSMLEETANITISSFMNGMASHLNKKCVPNAPVFLMDMAGSIISVILMESAEISDLCLIFSTQFECQDDDLEVLFIFVPNPESLERLKEGVTI